LFYVGLTRAQSQVFLTRARSRTLWGKRRRTHLSPLAEVIEPVRLSGETKRGRKPGQKALFPEMRPQGPQRGRRLSRGTVFPNSPEESNR
jgi:ATP-dependent exoDNAse (exonuclease V) beta subunit